MNEFHLGAPFETIRSRQVDNGNGLNMRILEAGFEQKGRPRLLLLHGFPELAYSWRHIMQPLADAGFHVIAPDQRGYGRTTGWDPDYNGDLYSFSLLNIVRDALGLVFALGYKHIDCVIGHDFGSPIAAYCALIRPDVFSSVVMMSAPFGGPPGFSKHNCNGDSPPANATRTQGQRPQSAAPIDVELANLRPPKQHYQRYFCSEQANADMKKCAQGISDFLRAYFHQKSADWKGNEPHELDAWNAAELNKMPSYYIMDGDKTMAETVGDHMPSSAEIQRNHWLPDNELAVYASEYSRTGFQGGLQWYRCALSEQQRRELALFNNQTIDVPSCFIAGSADWGVYQQPGALHKMQYTACSQMLGCHLIENAGHWVQQEQPAAVVALLTAFLKQARLDD